MNEIIMWKSEVYSCLIFLSFDLPQSKIDTRVHTTKKVALRFKEGVNTTTNLCTIHTCICIYSDRIPKTL